MTVYWLEQREMDMPSGDDWLSASELSRLGGMRIPKRRADWRLGRWTAKLAVATWLRRGTDPELLRTIEVLPEASGAPGVFVDGNRLFGAAISLSHRTGFAMCAVAPQTASIGCDLESIEARSDGFVRDYFVAEEIELITSAHTSDRPVLATLIWSAKESALKALGEGLRLDTKCVAVSFADGISGGASEDTWRALRVNFECGRVFHGWWRSSEGFVRTLVADPAPYRPVQMDSFHLATNAG